MEVHIEVARQESIAVVHGDDIVRELGLLFKFYRAYIYSQKPFLLTNECLYPICKCIEQISQVNDAETTITIQHEHQRTIVKIVSTMNDKNISICIDAYSAQVLLKTTSHSGTIIFDDKIQCENIFEKF